MANVELVALQDRAVNLHALADQAHGYLAAAKAENTKRAYRSDWADFTSWCQGQSFAAMPAAAETVALYITHLAAFAKPATIQRRISAISQAHQAAGYDSPTHTAAVRGVWAGIRRTKGVAQRGKAALLTTDLRAMLDGLDESPLGVRDRALILLGYSGAFRRSELVCLDLADLDFNMNGLTVVLRRSKTDQEGEGEKKGIPYGSCPDTCPVRSLQTWIQVAGIALGPIFRSVNRHGQVGEKRLTAQSVALVVQKRAEAAGLDPGKYAGHSLRAGMATQAAIAGASERSIMRQTGHRSTAMVRRYIRDGNLFRDNASGMLGL